MEKLISEFSLGLFFWQTLIFVGLIFLLKKYAWKPILSAVNEREASIKDALEACLLYTSPRPRDATLSRMPYSA